MSARWKSSGGRAGSVLSIGTKITVAICPGGLLFGALFLHPVRKRQKIPPSPINRDLWLTEEEPHFQPTPIVVCQG